MRNFPCSLVVVVLLTQAGDAEPLTYVLPEETATLRPGPDMETARDNCMSCHSVDYINTQPPVRGKEFWEGEVRKMIKSYHAPISEADAKTIADYLSNAY
jgi:sulfite dehydrogenase (cytochrome) subunit B